MKIKKIKLTFAIFSGLIILSFGIFALAQENSIANGNIFQDSDQDGLSNEEEKTYGTNPEKADTDGDGYSDGIEVRSGYDPLKPSPGDKIITEKNNEPTITVSANENGENNNLTEELSEKVAELIQKSETDNEEIDMTDIDSLIDQTTAPELTFSDLPEIDKSTIKILDQSYSKLSKDEKEAKKKEDAVKYLTTVGYILMKNSPQEINDNNDLQSFYQKMLTQTTSFSNNTEEVPEYFESLAEKGKLITNQLKDVEVPEDFLGTHTDGLKLGAYAASIKEEFDSSTNDPIAKIVSTSKVENLLSLT
jgi:hypothetical protein